MINSICVVRLSALGDVLMCVPLIRTLQKNLPKARITWVICRPAFDLVEGLEGIEFVVIDKPKGLKDYWRFARLMRKQHFDVLLAAQASLRANLLYPLIRAKRKIGFDKLRAKDGHGLFVSERIEPGNDHTLESFLKFSKPLSIPTPVVAWNLPIEDAAIATAQHLLPKDSSGPLVLVNPAASKPERSWLTHRYIEVIHHLQKQWHATVALTGGPGLYDKFLGEQIEQKVNVINLIGKTRPKQLLAVIKSADLIICPDTGPSHMGTAVGTPVMALHAVTSSKVSGPYLYRYLAVDAYPEAVAKILKNNTENNVWGTHVHSKEAMPLVRTAEVISKIDSFFVNTRPNVESQENG